MGHLHPRLQACCPRGSASAPQGGCWHPDWVSQCPRGPPMTQHAHLLHVRNHALSSTVPAAARAEPAQATAVANMQCMAARTRSRQQCAKRTQHRRRGERVSDWGRQRARRVRCTQLAAQQRHGLSVWHAARPCGLAARIQIRHRKREARRRLQWLQGHLCTCSPVYKAHAAAGAGCGACGHTVRVRVGGACGTEHSGALSGNVLSQRIVPVLATLIVTTCSWHGAICISSCTGLCCHVAAGRGWAACASCIESSCHRSAGSGTHVLQA